MNRDLVYLAQARRDADLEWHFLESRSGPRLADRFLAAMNLTSKMVVGNPDIGKLCQFQAPSIAAVRQMPLEPPFEKWLLFYLPSSTGILVLRVVHGARDLPALFD